MLELAITKTLMLICNFPELLHFNDNVINSFKRCKVFARFCELPINNLCIVEILSFSF